MKLRGLNREDALESNLDIGNFGIRKYGADLPRLRWEKGLKMVR